MKGSTVRQLILVAVIAILCYFYITNKAVRTNVVTKREVITVVDTVETVQVEERWRTTTKLVRDTLYIIKPDTVLVSVPSDGDDLLNWREWVVRMNFQPPKLEFTSTTEDSTYKHYIYEEIPWGFLIEPNNAGMLDLQLIQPPQPTLEYEYGWGVGYELGSGLAVYGLAGASYKQWKLNLIVSAHINGLRGSIILMK